LWERWARGGAAMDSCAILTTEANSLMAPIHNRMPVMIDEENFYRWLDPESKDVDELLAPWKSERIRMHPVTTKMNRVGYDDPDCLEPLEAQSSPPRGSGEFHVQGEFDFPDD
jgi:putative SOS response-associated peptidase YedK